MKQLMGTPEPRLVEGGEVDHVARRAGLALAHPPVRATQGVLRRSEDEATLHPPGLADPHRSRRRWATGRGEEGH
jgi:hypothetical protein